MGIALIAEVMDYAPADLTPAELVVLLVLAESASDATREAWPGMERLVRRTRLSVTGVRAVFRRLAARGIEVRVARGTDKHGQPVYAVRGKQPTYRLPVLAPEGVTVVTPNEATESGAVVSSQGVTLVTPNPGGVTPVTPSGVDDVTVVTPKPAQGVTTVTEGVTTDAGRRHGGDALLLNEPSENPHQPPGANRRAGDGAEPPKWTPPPHDKEIPEGLPQPLRIIAVSLRTTNPDATLDEARAVWHLVSTRHTPKSAQYYATIAKDAGFGGYLAEVRRARGAATEKAIQQLRRTEPPCEHGTPAGRAPHPVHGTVLCPDCRRGAPVRDPRQPDPNPIVAATITEYRKSAQRAGQRIETQQLLGINQQAKRLVAAGASLSQLLAAAATAALSGVDLFTAAANPTGSSA